MFMKVLDSFPFSCENEDWIYYLSLGWGFPYEALFIFATVIAIWEQVHMPSLSYSHSETHFLPLPQLFLLEELVELDWAQHVIQNNLFTLKACHWHHSCWVDVPSCHNLMSHYSFNLDSPFRIVITHSCIWIMYSSKMSISCLPVKALPGKENQKRLYEVPFCCPNLIHPKDFKANQLRGYSGQSLNLGSWDSSNIFVSQ